MSKQTTGCDTASGATTTDNVPRAVMAKVMLARARNEDTIQILGQNFAISEVTNIPPRPTLATFSKISRHVKKTLASMAKHKFLHCFRDVMQPSADDLLCPEMWQYVLRSLGFTFPDPKLPDPETLAATAVHLLDLGLRSTELEWAFLCAELTCCFQTSVMNLEQDQEPASALADLNAIAHTVNEREIEARRGPLLTGLPPPQIQLRDEDLESVATSVLGAWTRPECDDDGSEWEKCCPQEKKPLTVQPELVAAVTPPPPKTTTPLVGFCEVCKMKYADKEAHEKTQRHEKCLHPERGAMMECRLCKITLFGQRNWEQHVNGEGHRKLLEKIKNLEIKIAINADVPNVVPARNPDFWCALCEVEATGSKNMQQHLAGAQHQRRLAQLHHLMSKASNPVELSSGQKEQAQQQPLPATPANLAGTQQLKPTAPPYIPPTNQTQVVVGQLPPPPPPPPPQIFHQPQNVPTYLQPFYGLPMPQVPYAHFPQQYGAHAGHPTAYGSSAPQQQWSYDRA